MCRVSRVKASEETNSKYDVRQKVQTEWGERGPALDRWCKSASKCLSSNHGKHSYFSCEHPNEVGAIITGAIIRHRTESVDMNMKKLIVGAIC